MFRTSSSWKRRAWPFAVERISSCVPSVCLTSTRWSPSRSVIALIPDWRGRENWLVAILATCPCRVEKNRYRSSRNSRIGITAVTQFVPEVEQVHDRLAPARARGLGDLVDLEPVEPAVRGEAEQVVVHRGQEDVVDLVLLLGRHPDHAAPAAVLGAVGLEREALDVVLGRDRDQHGPVLDQVLDVEQGLVLARSASGVRCRTPCRPRRPPSGSRGARSPRTRGSVRAARSS